jgi:Fur family peroxide stress response transcriptional regulator
MTTIKPRKENTGRRLEEMLKKLKERDFRVTPQRLAVLKILASSANHPSVEMIYTEVKKTFPTTSLATVYKTVILLKELNQVLEIGFPAGSNRYDGNKPLSHPHLICMQCETIIDPDLESFAHVTEELVAETGFKIVSHRLDFFGICPACLKKKR